jgi:hypothetical protein
MKTLTILAMLAPLTANAVTYSTCPNGGCTIYTNTVGSEPVTHYPAPSTANPNPTPVNVTYGTCTSYHNIDLIPTFEHPYLIIPSVRIGKERYAVNMELTLNPEGNGGTFRLLNVTKF